MPAVVNCNFLPEYGQNECVMGVGRCNYLFFGLDSGGERAAIIYALIEACKLNGMEPQRYLEYILERIAECSINRIEELPPWNVLDKLNFTRETRHLGS